MNLRALQSLRRELEKLAAEKPKNHLGLTLGLSGGVLGLGGAGYGAYRKMKPYWAAGYDGLTSHAQALDNLGIDPIHGPDRKPVTDLSKRQQLVSGFSDFSRKASETNRAVVLGPRFSLQFKPEQVRDVVGRKAPTGVFGQLPHRYFETLGPKIERDIAQHQEQLIGRSMTAGDRGNVRLLVEDLFKRHRNNPWRRLAALFR